MSEIECRLVLLRAKLSYIFLLSRWVFPNYKSKHSYCGIVRGRDTSLDRHIPSCKNFCSSSDTALLVSLFEELWSLVFRIDRTASLMTVQLKANSRDCMVLVARFCNIWQIANCLVVGSGHLMGSSLRQDRGLVCILRSLLCRPLSSAKINA